MKNKFFVFFGYSPFKNSFCSFLSLNFLFLFFFTLIHIVHINLFFNRHILNILLTDILISLVLVLLVVLINKFRDYFIIFTSLLSSFLISLLYSILIPVMLDRSVTVNMLLNISANNQTGISRNKLIKNDFLENIYNKRLREQFDSGLIKLKGNKIKLTLKGKIVTNIFKINNVILNINKDK